MSPMRPFNLLRYFGVASLGVIAVLALATGWIFSQNLEQSLAEEGGFYAEDVAAALNRAIFQEFLLPRARGGEAIDLENPAQLAELDRIVEDQTQGLRIITVILFDTSGTIIYSTNESYIGYRAIDNAGLTAALGGKPATLLKRAELERDPIRPGHDLLETYAPFYELDVASAQRGKLIGVIEIYQDARRITRKIAQGQRRILLATAGLMALLFAALFEIVRRGHVRIGRLTEELATANLELEERVRERTREIEESRRQVVQSESLANLGQLAAGVAHEIRNPIGMIASSAQLLGREDALSERDRELLGVIRQEAARVSGTITEFVNFASPPRPSRTATDVSSLLLRAQTMLRPEAERRGISLELELEPELPKILVDPELLHRALANLVLNALQAQGQGGLVRLAGRRESGGGVALRVEDRGPGIREEDLERIFQPFFTKRPGGTGLGLSIVQRIAVENGGRVSVSSGVEGTVFTLHFPRAQP